ncbi:MAG TPA: PCRF domain-containing protein, partial [Thermodesulfobacteriaceae bacterium]|nr:PCRF domain-containing protein [Thermodesulfobacteriaceae bacterium]
MLTTWEAIAQKYEDIKVLFELALEEKDEGTLLEVKSGLAELDREVAEEELKVLLSGEHDASNAIVTIHAGAGG